MAKKLQTFIGVDPGLYGAVSVISAGSIEIFDVPMKDDGVGKKKKKVYDPQAMAKMLRPYRGQNTTICIESVHSMPGQGVSSSFAFGRGLGLWEGIAAGLDMNVKMVTPQSWKKQWGEELLMTAVPKPGIFALTPQEIKKQGKEAEFIEAKKDYDRKKSKQKEAAKDAARLLASKLYPALSDKFQLKKHDGRAESLLIAERMRLEITNAKR